MKLSINFITILCLFLSCQSDTSKDESDCSTGQPVAIFSDSMETISQHSFRVNGQNSEEKVLLSNQVELSFFQSGCETVLQEFKFELPTGNYTTQPDSFFVQKAGESLMLAVKHQRDPASVSLGQFGNDLFHNAAYVQLKKTLPIAAPLFFTIDKVATEKQGVVHLEIFSQ